METTALTADSELLRQCWDALVAPGDVHEVRIPKSRRGPARLWGTVSGYFSEPEAFVTAISPLTGADAEGIYLTLNPVDPSLLARAHSRLIAGKPTTTTDADVLQLRHVLIDIDPIRKSGISATDEELAAAITVRKGVSRFLREEVGWPQPVAITRSGNGGGLLYRIDSPNEPAAVDLLRRMLVALHALFGTATVAIDTTTGNPSRLTKVIGTVAAKGEDLPDRPWRLATARFNTGLIVPVPQALLESVAALAPQPAKGRTLKSGASEFGCTWDIRALLQDAGIAFTEVDKGYASVLRLDRCLASDDHTDGACLLEFPSGALAYRCHHARCAGKGWADIKARLGVSEDEETSAWSTFGHGQNTGTATGQASPGTSSASRTTPPPWPTLDPAALHGLAGDVVRTISPHTEGDPVAILLNFLTMFGSAVGPAPFAPVGATRHRANLFVVHVGETARARKGTAHDEALRLVHLADLAWLARVVGGLSSGEGLIHAVRDATSKINKDGKEVVDDPGVDDKRLLAVEPEFSSVLRVASREGNTLTEVLRRAWDGTTLRTLTRNAPLTATGAHIAILGHITRDELRRELTETSQLNGYANRHLFICVRRSKLLPHGGSLAEAEVQALVRRVREALQAARRCTAVRRDAEANLMWEAVYPALTADRPGMLGAITARAEAQVLRLSLIYALLDGSSAIQRPHLEAALAVWQYAEDSARCIFGDATGDPIADRILVALRANGAMAQTELVDLFGRHVASAKLGRALEALVAAGLIRSVRVETGGRPRTVWEVVA